MRAVTILLVLMCMAAMPVDANNLQITSVSLTGQNTTSDYTMVRFTISWEHAWRDPLNHDAAWVFIKYRVGPTGWAHATLSTTAGDHTAPTGSMITPSPDGKGVLISLSSNGSGTANFVDVELRWNYGADGVGDNDLVTLKMFGVEMVYVPQGAFHLGDGTTTDVNAQFSDGASIDPFLVTGEGSLTLGGGSPGSIGNQDYTGVGADDFNNAATQTLPAAFPKGYAPFYCMKHEISEGLWVGFFNCLTTTQKTTLDITGSTGKNADTEEYRNSIAWVSGDATTAYPDRACSYLGTTDALAFLDWAALRPITELEFEKACRGDEPAVADEFAWGTASAVPGNVIRLGPEDGTDTMASATANCIANASNLTDGSGSIVNAGPIRCGIFATPTANRVKAGATYYGILDFSGGVSEQAVTIGNGDGRAFTGLHGDGSLTAAGAANVTNWSQYMLVDRGGHFQSALKSIRVSDRAFPVSWPGRGLNSGFRGGRTAP